MADRGHADGDQVVGRQVRQDVSVDFVVAERRLVLSKTELLQSTRDIDRHRRSNSQGRLNIRRLHHDRNRAVYPCYVIATRLWLDKDDQWTHIMTDEKHVAATDFKANCLRLMDEVARQRRPIVITKRGKPIAKLVPVETEAIDLFGRMAGSIKICGDIINPIEDAGWTGDAENL